MSDRFFDAIAGQRGRLIREVTIGRHTLDYLDGPDVHPCPLCGEPLGLNDADAVYSYLLDMPVHSDCLVDSGEFGGSGEDD